MPLSLHFAILVQMKSGAQLIIPVILQIIRGRRKAAQETTKRNGSRKQLHSGWPWNTDMYANRPIVEKLSRSPNLQCADAEWIPDKLLGISQSVPEEQNRR